MSEIRLTQKSLALKRKVPIFFRKISGAKAIALPLWRLWLHILLAGFHEIQKCSFRSFQSFLSPFLCVFAQLIRLGMICEISPKNTEDLRYFCTSTGFFSAKKRDMESRAWCRDAASALNVIVPIQVPGLGCEGANSIV